MEKWIRIGLFIVGIAGILDSFFILKVSNYNLGNIFPALAGIIFILYTVFYTQISLFTQHGIGKIIYIMIQIGILFFLCSFLVCIFIITKFASDKPQNGADAIIILGAGLHGDKVSQSLAYRLDEAANYYYNNQNSIIVVSGGQGQGELVSEAFAMKQYLMQKGIEENKLLMEDKSTNTNENFRFSKKILDEYFQNESYKIVYVTNNFHTFRSGLIAKKAGLQAEGLSSPSTPYLLPNFYIREYFSVMKYFALDSWR